jgi:hypothetical protein
VKLKLSGLGHVPKFSNKYYMSVLYCYMFSFYFCDEICKITSHLYLDTTPPRCITSAEISITRRSSFKTVYRHCCMQSL